MNLGREAAAFLNLATGNNYGREEVAFLNWYNWEDQLIMGLIGTIGKRPLF